jgi:hypothetical protein
MLTPLKKLKTLSEVALSATDRADFMAIIEPHRAALDIPEILENVLRFLRVKNVFGVQRVCRQWKDLIASSPAIQEKLFLRPRNDTSETWLSIDSNSIPCDVENLPPNSELKFRMVGTLEAESGAWQNTSFGATRLFKPVALNPLLYRWIEGSLIDELRQGVGHAFGVDIPASYSPHYSFRDTHLTGPPCKECRMDLTFKESRPGPHGCFWSGANKPLTRRSHRLCTELPRLVQCEGGQQKTIDRTEPTGRLLSGQRDR